MDKNYTTVYITVYICFISLIFVSKQSYITFQELKPLGWYDFVSNPNIFVVLEAEQKNESKTTEDQFATESRKSDDIGCKNEIPTAVVRRLCTGFCGTALKYAGAL